MGVSPDVKCCMSSMGTRVAVDVRHRCHRGLFHVSESGYMSLSVMVGPSGTMAPNVSKTSRPFYLDTNETDSGANKKNIFLEPGDQCAK